MECGFIVFHDHDWEPEILMNVLNSKAFYIGAQGSHRAKKMRELELEAAGANYLQIDRVRGPLGLFHLQEIHVLWQYRTR